MNASAHQSSEQASALAQLCAIYWYPIYAFIRRQGYPEADAKDATQGFFARLIEKGYLQQADRSRGKFRSFVLASVKHFLSNERQKQDAQKRGGGLSHISLDELAAENRYKREPATDCSPDRLFERNWATTLLDRVRLQLKEQYNRNAKAERFEVLQSFLPGETNTLSYADAAARLGGSEGALRVELHRMKDSFRQLLRSEIAETVQTPDQIDEEIRELIQALT